eukprot:TRINITY_DN573_c0_g1_i1.p1 TRINITY_DN573_c0_g1~~TRINITY_DN573_c0_g1_i1.p1  ORF type:complete len:253 (-),score=62.46 TRINITY_DN573_c0_g1_i1:377-1135(-)
MAITMPPAKLLRTTGPEFSLVGASRNPTVDAFAMAPRSVHVEVVMDMICPWCYIGEAKLQKALAAAKQGALNVSVTHTSFMLRPEYPKEGVDKFAFFQQKFGAQGAQEFYKNIQAAAKNEGLDFAPLQGMKTGNTADAHRLLAWARSVGKDEELRMTMYKAYNTEQKWLGDHDVLLQCAKGVGLPAEDAKAVLSDRTRFAPEMEESLQRSRELGVTGVPAFYVNGKFLGSGAQPAEILLQAMDAEAQHNMGF